MDPTKILRVFYRVTPDVIPRCLENPSFCEDVLAGDEEGLVETFDIEQAWDAVHYCVSPNRAYPDQGELEEYAVYDHVITGNHVVHKGLNVGHGAARYNDPETVRAVAQALVAMTEEQIRDNFDTESMDAAEVHPEIWNTNPDDCWDYIWEHFLRLREFYQRAASDGHAVITWIIPVDEAAE